MLNSSTILPATPTSTAVAFCSNAWPLSKTTSNGSSPTYLPRESRSLTKTLIHALWALCQWGRIPSTSKHPHPTPPRCPSGDLFGNAALILTGSYNEQEFVRVGYYQFTEYDNEEMKENPPAKVVKERMVRNITTKPRVTRFQIKWCVCFALMPLMLSRL